MQRELTLGGCPLCEAQAPFTWWHVQFECSHAELVPLRAEWTRRLQSWKELISGALVPSRAVHLALRTLAGHTGRGAAEEVDVRRVVAGFLEGSGDVRVDRAGSTRKAATALAVAGLELQVLATRRSAKWANEVREKVSGMTMCSRLMRGWYDTLLRGGPGRAAALRRVSDARVRADFIFERLRIQGLMGSVDGGMAGAMARSCAKASALQCSTTDSAAAPEQGWRCLYYLRWWQLYTVKRTSRARLGQPAPEIHDWECEELVEAGLGRRLRVFSRVARVRGLARASDGLWVPGLDELLLSSLRHVLRVGFRERPVGVKSRVSLAALERQRARLATWQLSGSCSGAPLEDVGEQIEVVIGARSRGYAKARRRARAVGVVAALRLGSESDDFGRWALREVIVRRAAASDVRTGAQGAAAQIVARGTGPVGRRLA